MGDQLSDVLHLRHNIVHRASCGVNLVRTGLYLIGAGINQLADIIGGTGATTGKMTHLTRHHREPFPLLARSCGFNGGVQGQNVSLEGNIVNQRGDGADPLGAVGDIVHGFDDSIHRLTAVRCRAAGGNRELIGRGSGL